VGNQGSFEREAPPNKEPDERRGKEGRLQRTTLLLHRRAKRRRAANRKKKTKLTPRHIRVLKGKERKKGPARERGTTTEGEII